MAKSNYRLRSHFQNVRIEFGDKQPNTAKTKEWMLSGYSKKYQGGNDVTNYIFMEKRNVRYIDRPHAILDFLRAGFSVDGIQITRVDASHYDMFAKCRA